MVDTVTKRWIKTKADERAASQGCWFNEKRAEHVTEFFRRFLRHSKGEFAGKPFELLNWQRDEVVYPLFGWERPDGTRRFRRTYVEVPKKNGKSTLASGIGLYLLVGDGEAGAEVYSAATDQNQASIVHGEAVHMVEASPELSAILQVNRSTKAISFPLKKSVYRALSSEAPSKEGLNAHGLIADELHVWQGEKFWNALKYAFAARRQPLCFVITTAGDDPLSICYQQFQYAKQILNGSIDDDDRFFAFIRAAETGDDWTDEKVWLKANPSMGYGEEAPLKVHDFAAEVKEAQALPTTQANFKRYRLNIWQTAASPWVPIEQFDACKADYTADDLLGQDCFGGLDLAKTRDTTAFVLIFPGYNDTYRILPFFWLPEQTLIDGNLPSEFREWVSKGYLELTPGNVCDYTFVEKRIVELSHKYNLRGFAYDPYNAEQMTQTLDENYGIQRTLFKQTINNFAEPTKEFERQVVSGKLQHNGHPLFRWQFGNVNIKTDASGNQRPVKPEFGDNRKIDGPVAAIMALGLAMQDETVRESAIAF